MYACEVRVRVPSYIAGLGGGRRKFDRRRELLLVLGRMHDGHGTRVQTVGVGHHFEEVCLATHLRFIFMVDLNARDHPVKSEWRASEVEDLRPLQLEHGAIHVHSPVISRYEMVPSHRLDRHGRRQPRSLCCGRRARCPRLTGGHGLVDHRVGAHAKLATKAVSVSNLGVLRAGRASENNLERRRNAGWSAAHGNECMQHEARGNVGKR